MLNNQSRTGQAFWLGIGNLVSFSFGLVSAAILSRLLSVEEYGTYRQVLYVYTTLLTVFTLGLPRAYSFFLARMPIEKGKRTIDKINSLFLLLGVLFSLSLFLGANVIGNILNNPALPECLRYFSLTPMFLLPVMGIESILVTYKRTLYATLYIILSRVFNLICIVLPVMIFHGGANSAVIGFTVSSGICCIIGLVFERSPFKGIKEQTSSLSLADVLKYSFPLLLASLWGIIINSAPQFFISRWYGTDAFAEFANGFIELPFAGMVISAVATVLLPEISRLSKDGDNSQGIVKIWRSSFEKSALLIYPFAVFACIFASQIIVFLYGDNYTGAIPYFQIIIINNLVRVVPYAPIMMGMNMVKEYNLANMIPALFVIFIDYLSVSFTGSPYNIAVIQCFIILMHVAIMFYFISKKTKLSILKLFPIFFCIKIIGISALASFIAYVICSYYLYDTPVILKLMIAGILFMITLLPLSRLINIDYFNLVKPLFIKK